jgi:hypothetical protein
VVEVENTDQTEDDEGLRKKTDDGEIIDIDSRQNEALKYSSL